MLKQMPRSIWALGFVSMFMDISSEMIHSLLPVFMVSVLGASVTLVGVMEGNADALAQITKIFSGTLSDYLGKRKLLTLLGYGMAACAKPLLPLAHSIPTALAGRFIDRIGKGVRDAPRDALIGDIVAPGIRGAAFGLRQSLDTIGAVLGPVIALLLMELLAGNIRAVLWIAIVPAFMAVVILAVGVKELVIMNIVYALAAYPTGHLSDSMNRKNIVLIGAGFLLIADVVLGMASNLWILAIGIILWGLHMGFTQGLLAALVTDTTPSNLRGTAYGVYNFICGIALLAASIIAGALWDKFGPAATFFTGAGFTAIAMLGLFLIRNQHYTSQS
jgi:MFS family permease